MSYLINKPDFASQMYKRMLEHAAIPGEKTDGMRLVMLLSGILTETLLLFDEPEEGFDCSMVMLSDYFGCLPYEGQLGADVLPPAYLIDNETELGRTLARDFFEEWLNCAHEFHDLVLFFIHNIILRLECEGMARSEMFRIFYETTRISLSYEMAAQELCDVVIDKKIDEEGWSLGESISGLSAISGRRFALSRTVSPFSLRYPGPDTDPGLPDELDHISYVMTQEASRLGLPAGADWRFGLAANDIPVKAPYDLITSLEPDCWEIFHVMGLNDAVSQSVACAKAAGRMLAVAAGGDVPELEPVIAKPLAMAAMAETYKTVCEEACQALC
jgi:hypothetical protein